MDQIIEQQNATSTVEWVTVVLKDKCPALTQLLLGAAQATQRRVSCEGCPFLLKLDSTRDDLINHQGGLQSVIDTSGQMPRTPQIGVQQKPPLKSLIVSRGSGDNGNLQPDYPTLLPGIHHPGSDVPSVNTVDHCKMLEEQIAALRPLCRYADWQHEARKELVVWLRIANFKGVLFDVEP